MRNNIFIFDPLEESKAESILKRADILKKICDLPSIKDTSFFKMVLDLESSEKLREISQEISQHIERAIKVYNFIEAASYLKDLSYLKILKHELVDRLYSENIEKINHHARQWGQEAKNLINDYKFNEADEKLASLDSLSHSFYPDCNFSDLIKDIESFMQEKKNRKRLLEIEAELGKICDQIDRSTIWSLNGIQVLTVLNAKIREGRLTNLYKIGSIKIDIVEINKILGEAREIDRFLKEDNATVKFVALYQNRFDVLKQRLEVEARSELEKINVGTLTIFSDIDAKLTWQKEGKEILYVLLFAFSNRQLGLDQCLLKLSSFENLDSLSSIRIFLQQTNRTGKSLKTTAPIKAYESLCWQQLNHMVKKLKKMEADEKCKFVLSEIPKIFSEIHAHWREIWPDNRDQLLEILEKHGHQVDHLLLQLLKFKHGDNNKQIEYLQSLLQDVRNAQLYLENFSKIEQDCLLVYRNGFERLREDLQKEKAAALVPEAIKALNDNEYKLAKQHLDLTAQLDPSQSGGIEALKNCIINLQKDLWAHFKSRDYDSAKKVYDHLKTIYIIFYSEIRNHNISLDIELLDKEIFNKIQLLKERFDSEIEAALDEKTLDAHDPKYLILKLNLTKWKKIQAYWGAIQKFESKHSGEFKQICGTFIQKMEDLTPMYETQFSGLQAAAFFTQLRGLAVATQYPEFIQKSKELLNEFLDYRDEETVCTMGYGFNYLREKPNQASQYAAAIIDEQPRFRMISNKIFNDKIKSRKRNDIISELGLEDNKPLSTAFTSFEVKYQDIVDDICSNSSEIEKKMVDAAKKQADELKGLLDEEKFSMDFSTRPQAVGLLLACVFGGCDPFRR